MAPPGSRAPETLWEGETQHPAAPGHRYVVAEFRPGEERGR